jgi:hypothetical protein
MKPYVLMLLIGAIAALSDLVGGNEAARGEPRQTLPARVAIGYIAKMLVAVRFALIPRLVVLPVLMLLIAPAHGQELADEVEVGTSLICNTREQVKRFVALYDGDSESTANGVNAIEHDPSACAVSAMAYVRGRQLATARNKDTAFQIVPILALGVVTESGVQSVTPAAFFSLFEIEEIGI